MATKTKKTTQKKVVKKVNYDNDFVEVEKPISDEEKIFGASAEMVREQVINYENPKIKYKVSNLQANNNAMIVSGDLVETFIGSENVAARDELKKGLKEVITYDNDHNPAYKIEVI